MTGDELIERYRDLSVHTGNEIFLTPKDALRVIDEISEEDMAVLSIEGFDLLDRFVRPRLDLIADYSPRKDELWAAHRDSTISAARDFLSRLLDSQAIAVILQLWTHDEWLIRMPRSESPPK
ncbi:MAG: hypothetical protein WD904_10750 [Dehalococcoidia bacterium]